MSSNLAGETGAVWIYHGALYAAKYRKNTDDVKAFCTQHLATEQVHLDYMIELLPKHMHTKLLPIWKVSGFVLGFLPTIIGRGPALYHSVEAVETFVEKHYNLQIDWLRTLHKKHPEVFEVANVDGEDNGSELIRYMIIYRKFRQFKKI